MSRRFRLGAVIDGTWKDEWGLKTTRTARNGHSGYSLKKTMHRTAYVQCSIKIRIFHDLRGEVVMDLFSALTVRVNQEQIHSDLL